MLCAETKLRRLAAQQLTPRPQSSTRRPEAELFSRHRKRSKVQHQLPIVLSTVQVCFEADKPKKLASVIAQDEEMMVARQRTVHQREVTEHHYFGRVNRFACVAHKK
jgi:hypothetical protein